MTHASDMLRLNHPGGASWINLADAGIEWPPPEMFRTEVAPYGELTFRRVSCSAITDEQIADMPNVFRGAEYEVTS